MSDKPASYREWFRQKVWPHPKRVSEGADSVLPHLEEFLEQPDLQQKRQSEKGKKPDSDKPRL